MVKQSLRSELAGIANDILRSEDRGEMVSSTHPLGQRVNLLIAQDQAGVLAAVRELTGQQRCIINRFAPDIPTPQSFDESEDGGEVTVVGALS